MSWTGTGRRFVRVVAGWGVVLAVAGSPSGAPADDGSGAAFQEKATGHSYPRALSVQGDQHVLVGVGVEKKRFLFLSFNVFSLGLYLEPEDARPRLQPWLDQPPDAVVKDKGLYQAINDNAIDKSMRMVVARDVTGDDLRDGFSDALVPRLERREDSELGLDALRQYMSYFEDRKLPDGSVMFFTCHSGGTLETDIDGESQPPIDSPALCWALVDTFLGEDPMNAELKRDLVRQVPRML